MTDDATELEDDFNGDDGDGVYDSVPMTAQDEGDIPYSSREALRRQLAAEVEAFLANGGKIREIPANVVSDPPRKPESNYGGQPI